MTEVLAAELCADAEGLREFEDLLLQLEISHRSAGLLIPGGGKGIEVFSACKLCHLGGVLRARPSDHDRQVIGRACSGSDGAQLLIEPSHETLWIEDRLRLLVEEGLVRTSATLCDEEEFVLLRVVGRGVDLDLGWEIVAGVLLLPCIHRRQLRIAEVESGVRVVDPA